jgi:sulfotransferase family protein
MYYVIVFLTVSLLSVGIILLKKPFFSFAYSTGLLLNSMLESNQDEAAKQKSLLRSLGKILPSFGLLLLLIALVIGVSIIPMIIYMELKSVSFQDLDMKSFYFFLSMILGSVILFVFPSKEKNKDYSAWSMLLHRMILDNYNISRSLFNLEKKLFKRKVQKDSGEFLIVTGLARGGTTALTNLLFESEKFHSLSYDNMPFLLSVNIWRKIYHPRKRKLKERAHGDNILFGYDTIEALEEYFFKVFLNDKYIVNDSLIEHDIDPGTYEAYLSYQNLVRKKDSDSMYLAKNNNLILRYGSLRTFNPDFYIILIFRSPISHAFSLLTQHKRFSKLHNEDPFTLEYMNWLGHHEFGLNHKVFDLEGMELRKKYDSETMDYWIVVWISYYTHILSMVEDEKLLLVDYSDLCASPAELLSTIGKRIDMELTLDQRDPYKERELKELQIDPELIDKSNSIHDKLKQYKIKIQ